MNQRPKLERTKQNCRKLEKLRANLYYDRFSNGSKYDTKSTSNKKEKNINQFYQIITNVILKNY